MRKVPFERLDLQTRATLVLYLAGFNMREIAFLLGCYDQGGVAKRIAKAKVEYKDDLELLKRRLKWL